DYQRDAFIYTKSELLVPPEKAGYLPERCPGSPASGGHLRRLPVLCTSLGPARGSGRTSFSFATHSVPSWNSRRARHVRRPLKSSCQMIGSQRFDRRAPTRA
ncbi:MAG: hypothetical protein AAB113_00955, partial [Candidatus Eisenbacteria bacterium]